MRSKPVSFAVAIGVAVAALLCGFGSWAGEGLIHAKPTNPGYVVTAKPGVSTRVIRRAFKPFKVHELKSLGGGAFHIVFKPDPGLKAVEDKAKKAPAAIETVQPNFTYKSSGG